MVLGVPSRTLQGIVGYDRECGDDGPGSRLCRLRSDHVEDEASRSRGEMFPTTFDAGQVLVAKEALARVSMDSADYPYPDLAIEIDTSPTQIDRPAIYREIGVTEVWRLVRAQELIIEQLGADGSYVPVEQSRFLHICAERHPPVKRCGHGGPSVLNRRRTEWCWSWDSKPERPAGSWCFARAWQNQHRSKSGSVGGESGILSIPVNLENDPEFVDAVPKPSAGGRFTLVELVSWAWASSCC